MASRILSLIISVSPFRSIIEFLNYDDYLIHPKAHNFLTMKAKEFGQIDKIQKEINDEFLFFNKKEK